MIPVKHIDPDDLALYAMHLLPKEEMEELGLHLQHSTEARRVLAEFYGDLALYAHTAEMHSPPALARQRLMKHVAREKKVVPAHLLPLTPAVADTNTPPAKLVSIADAPRKSTAARVLPWIGWAVAAGLGVEIANLYQQNHTLLNVATERQQILAKASEGADLANAALATMQDPSAVQVMLTSTGVKPPAQGRASYVQDKGSLIFLASNLEPLAPYKTYELWLIPADGHDPIAAGTFKPDAKGNASIVLPQLPKGIVAKAFGVTVEDGDGSPAPTTAIILKGVAG